MLPSTMRPPNDFRFEEPEGRPFRTVSIETEADGDPDAFALGLYKHGIVGQNRVMQYGFKPTPTDSHIGFVKYDNSVSAGELVFDRIDLTNPVHAAALYRAMEEVRSLEKNGKIAFNPNCGGHAHIDANGMGFYDVLRSLILYGHLEEPIVRLAGAGKKYGHRTLFRGHDQANTAGTGYSNPVSKGPFVDVQTAYAELTKGAGGGPHDPHRMRGINLTIYASCRCAGCGKSISLDGSDNPSVLLEAKWKEWIAKRQAQHRARYGVSISPQDVRYMHDDWMMDNGAGKRSNLDLKNCTCKQEKRTIEWRVWNSQSNPRILYAWIALMQALHAYTWRPSADLGVYRAYENLEPFDWEFTPYNRLSATKKKRAMESVDWMFSELPLTAMEKDALAYAYKRTPYKEWGKAFFDERMRQPYKPPPYPNVYKSTVTRKKIVECDTLAQGRSGKQSDPFDEQALPRLSETLTAAWAQQQAQAYQAFTTPPRIWSTTTADEVRDYEYIPEEGGG